MSIVTRPFERDFVRYEGVRPVNIWLMRLVFALTAGVVGTDVWSSILAHQGPWDHVKAVAFCTWAAYSALAVLGLFRPLRMVPLMLFMIFYKLIWLAIVAYPLWMAGTLWTSPAAEMAKAFLWVPLAIVAMPWGYAARTLLPFPARKSPSPQGTLGAAS